MGWLWACLGGGLNIQGSKRSRSLQRGKLSNQPHDLRLQPLPTQLPINGYGVHEPSHLQKVPSRGHKGGEPENMEAFKIPTSSVNTCISINTLKKASERSLESSFRREFGLSIRSDVDELKEELATLRRRLANEEAEAKKLRDEVSYLRSCGVLQRSEDSDMRIYDSVPEKEALCDQAHEEQQQGDIEPVRQLRKCFSGPLLFGSQSNSSKDSKTSNDSKDSRNSDDSKDSPESTGTVSQSTQTRISSQRAGLSPKGKSFVNSRSPEAYQKAEEDVVATTEPNPRVSKVGLTSGLHQYPSTKVAAWTSQIAEESQCMSRNLVIMDSMDVHWIEVSNAPCPSGFSTNVRRDDHHSQGDHAESPRRPKLRALVAAEDDTSLKSSQKLVGKRRQKRSVDFTEPTEKRSKEQSISFDTSQLPALTPEQIEEQLSQAVAAFKQQKRELELKHQSFCHGPTMTDQQPSNNMVGYFRNSRKKSHAVRNHRGFQRSLSPVKEALSIEEVTWSRQSSSRNESAVAKAESDSETGVSTKGTQGFKFSAKIVEDSSPVKMPPEEESENEELDERPSPMENIAMIPIQCISPSLSPKNRSSSSALDAICALAMSSKTPTESRYHMEDSVEGILHEADWIQDWEDDIGSIDMKPIECASPSFAERRKPNPRAGSVRQSISFDTQESSPLLASSGEFDDSFLSCGKSTPSPNRKSAFRSPGGRSSSVTPSPRKPWSPSKPWSTSPKKGMDSASPMINERSWYCDAIDAIQSINDMRRSKEGRLLTESVSLGNSPAGKKTGGPRPPHAFSAEKKILRRAFSWYVSEHDERVRTFGLKGRNGSEEPEEDGNEKLPLVPGRVHPQQRLETSAGRHGFLNAIRGTVLHARRFSDSDSGGSATFSIDFNRADSSQNSHNSSQNGSSQNNPTECDARESTGASFLRERVDKENVVARTVQSPSKNSVLRTSDQSSDSTKNLRRSQESIPENRPVLGSVPFNNWDKNVRTSRDKNPTDLYNEDTRSEWHPATTLRRALPKISSRGISGKMMARSRSFV